MTLTTVLLYLTGHRLAIADPVARIFWDPPRRVLTQAATPILGGRSARVSGFRVQPSGCRLVKSELKLIL